MTKSPILPKNISRKSSNLEGEDFILFDVVEAEYKTNTSLIAPVLGAALRGTRFFYKNIVPVNQSSGITLLVEAQWIDIIAARDKFALSLVQEAAEGDTVSDIERNYFLAWPVLNSNPAQTLLLIGQGCMGTGFSSQAMQEIMDNKKIKVIASVGYDSMDWPEDFSPDSKQQFFDNFGLDSEEDKGHKLWAAMESNTVEVYNVLKSKAELEKKLSKSIEVQNIPSKI